MTDLMDSPLLAPLADLLTPDKVETLQEMARVFYSNRSASLDTLLICPRKLFPRGTGKLVFVELVQGHVGVASTPTGDTKYQIRVTQTL